MKTGILVHVYHLEALGWEEVVWGDPARDTLGTLTRFADCLLDIPANEEVVSIIYSGPSSRDGLSEGAYTRQFLVDRIDRLQDFPRLRRKLERLSPQQRHVFTQRLHDLKPLVTKSVRTMDEIKYGAAYFAEQNVAKVLQITAVTHAPRCIKLQAVARETGQIPKNQDWFLAMGETGFGGSSAADIVVREPAHRGDDPLLGVHPSMSDVLNRFQYELSPTDRVEALRRFDRIVTELAPKPAPVEPVLETS